MRKDNVSEQIVHTELYTMVPNEVGDAKSTLRFMNISGAVDLRSNGTSCQYNFFSTMKKQKDAEKNPKFIYIGNE